MIARITPHALRGVVQAVPSKSEAHRALICAAFADRPCHLRMRGTSEDIEATIRCLRAFGTEIIEETGGLEVVPISRETKVCEADCGESASTLRFLLPVAAARGMHARFLLRGGLQKRPMTSLLRELARGGCTIDRSKSEIIEISGKLSAGAYSLPGNVSSQYCSGMLFALSLTGGESTLEIEGKIESADYIRMTLNDLRSFGVSIEPTSIGFRVHGRERFAAPEEIHIGGDWSNAAFWFCANTMPDCAIRIEGLDAHSDQGDRSILERLKALQKLKNANYVSEIHEIDAANIPDLIPPLAVCASLSGRRVRIRNASRLRLKETDRIRTISNALNAIGGKALETDDGLLILPVNRFRGGEADCAGDHRIAMMAAIASIASEREILIHGAEAVNKSYPRFWQDFADLGGIVEFLEA